MWDHQSQISHSSNQWLNLQSLSKVFHLPQRFLPQCNHRRRCRSSSTSSHYYYASAEASCTNWPRIPQARGHSRRRRRRRKRTTAARSRLQKPLLLFILLIGSFRRHTHCQRFCHSSQHPSVTAKRSRKPLWSQRRQPSFGVSTFGLYTGCKYGAMELRRSNECRIVTKCRIVVNY